MPAVSIIIPTYNHAPYVSACVESVLAQTFSDYEVIVINDGSPDNTREVLEPFARAGKIRYIEQPNAGVAHTRNRGIAMAQGRYTAFLDDDDLWPTDKLACHVEMLDKHKDAVLVYGRMELFDGKETYIWPTDKAPEGNVLHEFLELCWISSPGQTLIRTDALRAIGGLDPTIWGADDWDLYIRLAQKGPFLFSSGIALRYRVHEANTSKKIWKMYRNALKVTRKHYSLRGPNSPIRWFSGSKHMQRYFFDQSLAMAKTQGDRRQLYGGVMSLFRAVLIEPTSVLHRYTLKRLIKSFLGLFFSPRTQAAGTS